MMVADATFSCVYLPMSPSLNLCCVIGVWGSCLFQRGVRCLGFLLCGVLVQLHVILGLGACESGLLSHASQGSGKGFIAGPTAGYLRGSLGCSIQKTLGLLDF